MASTEIAGDGTQEREARFQHLMQALLADLPSKFSAFNIYRTSYISDGVDIGVDILVPKVIKQPGARPVMVRIHGGFLVTGSSLFPAWFTKWVLDYAQLHEAVIISPNYRLLPEVRGLDILEDMKNFWSWLQAGMAEQHLKAIGRDEIMLDLSRKIVVGESAGGYLALQSALCLFTLPQAMILAYPMLDLEAAHYTQKFYKPIVEVPNFPNQLVEDIAQTRHNAIAAVTEADPPVRLRLAMAMVQNGRFLEFLGREPILFPLRTIGADSRNWEAAPLPPLFVLHGEQDSAVPVEGTRKFVAELQRRLPSSQLALSIRPGEHGFDSNTSLDESWLQDGLRVVTEAWLH